MPALVFCGRRWFAASDDFVYFPAIFAVIRIAIVVFISVEYGLPDPRDRWVEAYNEAIACGVHRLTPSQSPNGSVGAPIPAPSNWTNCTALVPITPLSNADELITTLGAYCLCTMIVDSMCAVSDIALAAASFYGTILEVAKREHLVAIALAIRIAFTWFELGSAIFGAIFVFDPKLVDSNHFADTAPLVQLVRPVQIINVAQFCFVGVIVIAFISYFDPVGHREKRFDVSYAREWGKRCRVFFCCVWAEKKAKRTATTLRTTSARVLRRASLSPSGARARGDSMLESDDNLADAAAADEFDLTSVAELFANMFRNVDLVPSDIAAGLVLLRKKQKMEARRAMEARRMRSANDSFSPVLMERTRTRSASTFKISTQNTTSTRKLSRGDHLVLEELQFYVNFVVGAYGWPMLAMAHPATFVAKLCGLCFCGQPPPIAAQRQDVTRRPSVGESDELFGGGGADRVANLSGDNACHCNVAAMRYWIADCRAPAHENSASSSASASPASSPPPVPAEMHRADADIEIIYYSRDNDVFVVPFFVAHDHVRRTIVVSIRGTLSIHDAFTDLNAAAEPLHVGAPGSGVRFRSGRIAAISIDDADFVEAEDGSGSDTAALVAKGSGGSGSASPRSRRGSTASMIEGFAHKGMYHSADALYKKLMSGGGAHSSGGVVVETCSIPELLALPRYRGYTPVITGHSLGAGVAAILGCMLVSHFPSLRVYAFSPPGGLLSAELAALSERFCVTVAVGKDLVPRLSEIAIAELRDDLMTVLADTTRAKATIIGSCCSRDPKFLLNRIRTSPSGAAAYDDEPWARLQKFRRESATEPPRVQLFPPGIVWHMQKTHSTKRQRCCGTWCENNRTCSVLGCVEREECYYPIVVPRTHFSRILVSPIMVRDHMPWKVKAVIDQVVRNAHSGELDLLADEFDRRAAEVRSMFSGLGDASHGPDAGDDGDDDVDLDLLQDELLVAGGGGGGGALPISVTETREVPINDDEPSADDL